MKILIGLRLTLALLALVLVTPTAAAQDAASAAPASADAPAAARPAAPDPRLATPGRTLETFTHAMQAYFHDRAGNAAKLSEAKLCCDFGVIDLPAARLEAATDLYNVMNRIERIDAAAVPTPGPEPVFTFYPDPAKPYHLDLDERAPGHTIELTRNARGEWKISAGTLLNAGRMATDFERFDNRSGQADVAATLGQQIRNAMPASLRGSFLTVEYWQWLAILIVIFLGVLIDYLVRAILSNVWHRIDRKRDGPTAEKEILRKAVRPFGLVAAAGFWLGMISIGGISGTPLMVLLLAIRVVLSLGGVWAAWRLTDLVTDFLLRKAKETDNKYDDLLIPLLQRTLKIFIVAVGVIYIAKALHIDVLPLLTGLGIGGLAVAFAAKDTIENFFGSVAVIVDQPFEVGDWIVVEGVEGTVETLGFRSTRVRTFYNSLVTVPNAMLVRATVDNYGKRKYRRWSTMLNITYDTPPDTIEAFCEGIRELVRLHPYMRKDMFHVYLNSFGAHSLDIMLYVFFECPDWAIELRERQRLMLDIIRLADRMGVSFAFPTQTLELKPVDPDATHTPSAVPGAGAQSEAQREGARIARELTANQPWKREKPGPVVFRVARADDELEMRGDGGGE